MEIKQRPQRPSYVPKGTHPRKCEVCRAWKKNQADGPPLCLVCHFRNKAKEEAERAAANAAAPVKPNLLIGKL